MCAYSITNQIINTFLEIALLFIMRGAAALNSKCECREWEGERQESFDCVASPVRQLQSWQAFGKELPLSLCSLNNQERTVMVEKVWEFQDEARQDASEPPA
jgi:hypothetical protein